MKLFDKNSDILNETRNNLNASEEWALFLNKIGKKNFTAYLFFVRKKFVIENYNDKIKQKLRSLKKIENQVFPITKNILVSKLPDNLIEYLEYDKKNIYNRSVVLYSLIFIREAETKECKLPSELYEIIALMNILNDIKIEKEDYYGIKVIKGKLESSFRFLNNEYYSKPNKYVYFLEYKELEKLSFLYKKYKNLKGKVKNKINTALMFVLSIKEQAISQIRVILLCSAIETFIKTPERGVKKYFIEKCIELFNKMKGSCNFNLVENDFKEFYELRSSIVHGDIYLKKYEKRYDDKYTKASNLIEKIERFYEYIIQYYIIHTIL